MPINSPERAECARQQIALLKRRIALMRELNDLDDKIQGIYELWRGTLEADLGRLERSLETWLQEQKYAKAS